MTKPQQTNDALAALRAILGGPLTSVLGGAFGKMEIAEEEIADAKSRWPQHAERIHRAFRLLCPSEALTSAAEKLYRLHCRETLERIAAAEDTNTATRAELASVLSAMSLAAPLDRSAMLLYWRTFTALFPKDAEELRKRHRTRCDGCLRRDVREGPQAKAPEEAPGSDARARSRPARFRGSLGCVRHSWQQARDYATGLNSRCPPCPQ